MKFSNRSLEKSRIKKSSLISLVSFSLSLSLLSACGGAITVDSGPDSAQTAELKARISDAAKSDPTIIPQVAGGLATTTQTSAAQMDIKDINQAKLVADLKAHLEKNLSEKKNILDQKSEETSLTILQANLGNSEKSKLDENPEATKYYGNFVPRQDAMMSELAQKLSLRAK